MFKSVATLPTITMIVAIVCGIVTTFKGFQPLSLLQSQRVHMLHSGSGLEHFVEVTSGTLLDDDEVLRVIRPNNNWGN